MKLRVQYPLWNIYGFIMLLIIGWGVISLEGVNKDSDLGVFFQTTIFIGILILVLYSMIFVFLIIRYNKKNPSQKVNPFNVYPNEFVEDDEMFKQVTMRATKKVYSFIYMALPFLLGITLVAESRFTIYFGLVVIIIVQNLIYYKEMKKYVNDGD